MFKQKTILIAIITIVCGLVAGAVAFYRQQQTGQTVSVDIISTIVATEQEKSPAMTVTIDSLQYNQTLAAFLNVKANGRSPLQENDFSSMSWEADLNSAVLHGSAQVDKTTNQDLIPSDLVNIAEESAGILNVKQFDSKISTKLALLSYSQPSQPSLPSNPYFITFLGLLVGFFISTICLKANSD